MTMNKERLSQLIDGELSSSELETALDSVLDSADLQVSWQTMHTLRAAVDEKCILASNKLTDGVCQALDAETKIVAPNNIISDPPALARNSLGREATGKVIPLDRRHKTKLLTGLAMAASVAALAMLVIAPNDQREFSVADATLQSKFVPLEPLMQSMIVQHGEFTGAAALNGLLAYAKVVNDEPTGVSQSR